MKKPDSRIKDLMGKGLSRATAYRRLGGIGHCKSCSCFTGPNTISSVRKEIIGDIETISIKKTPLDTRIDRVQLKELRGNAYCPKHDVKKNKCLCP